MITIYKGSFRAEANGQVVWLSRAQLEVLLMLASGKAVSTADIVAARLSSPGYIRTTITLLRKKLGKQEIENIHGYGYRLTEPATIHAGIHPT